MKRSKREYKSGSRWAVFRWSYTDSGYLTRLFLLKTPWFAICLHWLNKPDPEPYVHDHPVTLLSLILRGGYVEQRLHGNVTIGLYRHRWYNFIRWSTRHTISHVEPKTLTLALMGPKKQDWGFFKRVKEPCCKEPHIVKIGWQDYYARKRRGEQV